MTPMLICPVRGPLAGQDLNQFAVLDDIVRQVLNRVIDEVRISIH